MYQERSGTTSVDLADFSRRKFGPPGGDRSTSSAHLSTRTSNTDWNTSAENMQKSINDHWPNQSLHQVYLRKSLYWKKLFMIHSALLQLQ